MRQLLLLFIKIYQKFISPTLPARCRYYPTCSAYARTALLVHTLPKALRFIIKRLLSCQPFGGSGVDFVPVPLYRYSFGFAKVHHKYGLSDCYSYRFFQNRLLKL